MEKYTLNLDINKYVLSIAHTSNDNIELDLSKYDLSYLNAYQYLDCELVLDEVKLKALKGEEEQKNKTEQIAKLKEELSTYDYIGVKIAMGVATTEEYSEKIAYTETLREKIRELEDFRTETTAKEE